MDVLVLGGTMFLGRHIVAAATARGHHVSTFTRGRSSSPAAAGVERLIGDRDGDVSALRGTSWDLVIDTSAYHPRQVHSVAAAIGYVGRYVLVSTVSVYASFPESGATEETATQRAMHDALAEPGPATYGALKVACEEGAAQHFPGRTIVLRPGVIVGPWDPTHRFAYWVHRVAAGGEVLAPGDPEREVQVLDARDFASFVLDLTPTLGSAVLNLAGPSTPLTMRELLGLCGSALSSNATFTWVSDEFLLDHGVVPWSELPLWLPSSLGPLRAIDAQARALGYSNRPLSETIADVVRDDSVSDDPLGGGLPKAKPMSRERERELLRLWHASG